MDLLSIYIITYIKYVHVAYIELFYIHILYPNFLELTFFTSIDLILSSFGQAAGCVGRATSHMAHGL